MNDVVVFVRMIKVGLDNFFWFGGGGDVLKVEFEIIEVIKGDEFYIVGIILEMVVFGSVVKNEVFMILGVDFLWIVWLILLKVIECECRYMIEIIMFLMDGEEWLGYFVNYFEDEFLMMVVDVYDEFVNVFYKDVIVIKDKMDYDKFVSWIQDFDVMVSCKCFYLMMFGICGSESDLLMFEEIICLLDCWCCFGFDVMIVCYLMLKGLEGLILIEEFFFGNLEVEYVDIYVVIMVICFYGSEEDIIERRWLFDFFELMFKWLRFVDFVIFDFVCWKDWEIMDELVEFFKVVDDLINWVCVFVINYF